MSTVTAEKKHRYHTKHIRKAPSEIAIDILIILLFVALSVICIYPFYYLFINSVSDKVLVESGEINFYPVGINFETYREVFSKPSISEGFLINILRTIIATVLMVFASAWAGYLVTRKKMWMRTFWYRFLVITMYFSAGLIPWFINMTSLGMKENFLAYILPCIVVPYNIILVKTYIESIPGSLEEAAVIDGASTPRIFFKIILPMSLPIIVAITAFGAINNWNSFQDSLLLMSDSSKLRTLQHVLFVESPKLDKVLGSNMYVSAYQFAAAMVSVIPILILYPFIHRFVVKCALPASIKN